MRGTSDTLHTLFWGTEKLKAAFLTTQWNTWQGQNVGLVWVCSFCQILLHFHFVVLVFSDAFLLYNCTLCIQDLKLITLKQSPHEHCLVFIYLCCCWSPVEAQTTLVQTEERSRRWWKQEKRLHL